MDLHGGGAQVPRPRHVSSDSTAREAEGGFSAVCGGCGAARGYAHINSRNYYHYLCVTIINYIIYLLDVNLFLLCHTREKVKGGTGGTSLESYLV